MTQNLTKGSITDHIKTLSIPASTGYLFHTLFNVTDVYFAGGISTQTLAALSLSGPVFFIIIAICSGMSAGATALIGNAIGENKTTHAKQIILHMLAIGAFLSVTLGVIGMLIAPILLKFLGASNTYLHSALSYISVVIMGIIFFICTFFCNSVLNSLGNTRAFRNFLVCGFVLNIVLDYWFVNGGIGLRPLGIKGIAFATVIVECMGASYLLWTLSKTYLMEDLPKFDFDWGIIRDFFAQGLPPTMNMLLMAFGGFILMYFMSPFGQEAVAGYGIALRVEQIALLPGIGLNVAVLAIVSQNNGAREFGRVKETVYTASKIGFFVCVVGGVFLFFASEHIMLLFSDDIGAIGFGMKYVMAAIVGMYGYVLIFIHISFLQGIKQPNMLVFLSLFRQILAPFCVFIVLRSINAPLEYYWWGVVGVVWISALYLIWYASGKKELLDELWQKKEHKKQAKERLQKIKKLRKK